MKGDYSRDTFDPAKHFTRVLMQQGRVQLDADWNEQTSILLHYLQNLARDLIGPAGGPKDFLGFGIDVQNQGSPPEITDLKIGMGRYYVDGLLCENVPPSDLIGEAADQGGPVHIEPAKKDATGIKPPSESPQQEVSYYHQPNYPRDPVPDELKASLLAYLDVWERHICAFEDPDIREVALRGPDTAARAKIVWQVRVAPWNDPPPPEDVKCAGFEETKLWKKLVAELQPANRGHLKARAYVSEDSDDPCLVAPEARYRGQENQLYRVEIHHAGAVGEQNNVATFKWSRENGAVVFPIIQSIEGASVTLENLGRDDRFGLEVGDWVEVVDDDYSLLGKADPLLRVEDIDPTAMRVTLSATPQGTVGQDLNKHPLLRRWDHQKGDPKTGGLDLANGAALIVESNNWLNLEDGVQIQFQGGAEYRTGDYWLIPARTETGDVEWPGPVDQPQAVPPHGVQHHYAPLALVFPRPASSPGRAAGSPGPPFATTDLRHRFAPAGQCCPTITLDYPLTALPQSIIRFAVLVNQTDLKLNFDWQVEGGAKPAAANLAAIEVVAAGTAKVVTATVTITGLPPFCPNVFEGTCTIIHAA